MYKIVRVDHTIVINYVSLEFADCSRNFSTTDKVAMYLGTMSLLPSHVLVALQTFTTSESI